MSRGDAERLQSMLAAAGVRARVEGREALAVVLPVAGPLDMAAESRQWLVTSARACGFSHVAVDVTPMAGDETPMTGDER